MRGVLKPVGRHHPRLFYLGGFFCVSEYCMKRGEVRTIYAMSQSPK